MECQVRGPEMSDSGRHHSAAVQLLASPPTCGLSGHADCLVGSLAQARRDVWQMANIAYVPRIRSTLSVDVQHGTTALLVLRTDSVSAADDRLIALANLTAAHVLRFDGCGGSELGRVI